jgi:hypothetical protein
MIIFATATAAGSLRSTNPSLRKAVSNAADIFLISSDRVGGMVEWARSAPDAHAAPVKRN